MYSAYSDWDCGLVLHAKTIYSDESAGSSYDSFSIFLASFFCKKQSCGTHHTSGSTRSSRFNDASDFRARSLVRFPRLSLSGKRDCS